MDYQFILGTTHLSYLSGSQYLICYYPYFKNEELRCRETKSLTKVTQSLAERKLNLVLS